MLDQFKNQTLGGSFGNPKTGTYKGQCVSYIRKYMEEVLGIPTYPAGDAKDYWNNKISTDHFDKVANPQNGDVVVYGAVPSNKYGHIGIWYNGQLLSQNYDKPLRVSIASLSMVGNRLGYLRKKGVSQGGDPMVDRGALEIMWKGFLDRVPTDEEYKNFVGKAYPSVLFTVFKSKEYEDRYKGLVDHYVAWKKAQDGTATATVLSPGVYKVK